jgi:hypothetical protein
MQEYLKRRRKKFRVPQLGSCVIASPSGDDFAVWEASATS